jgi:hypothetical protein
VLRVKRETGVAIAKSSAAPATVSEYLLAFKPLDRMIWEGGQHDGNTSLASPDTGLQYTDNPVGVI